jgi:hypothetical protein
MIWNATFQKRLSRLYETVQEAVRREVGARANVLANGKEAQRRGGDPRAPRPRAWKPH